MTTVEDRLRHALHARADTVAPAPDAWDGIARRLAPPVRRRGQRERTAALAAVAAAVVVVLGFVALARDRDRDGGLDEAGGPAGPAPTELVTVRGRDIVALDVGTGRPVRTISRPADRDPGVLPRNLAVTPDHRTVFFDTAGDWYECGGGVYEVPAAGGPPVLLAEGASNPAVSPDGRKVAMVAGPDELNCAVVVLDRATGARQTFAYPPLTENELVPALVDSRAPLCTLTWPDGIPRPVVASQAGLAPGLLAWAPDGRRLAVVTQEGRGKLDGSEQVRRVRVLDTATAQGLGDAELVGPAVGEKVTTDGWWNVAWRDATTLWALSSDRCGPPASDDRPLGIDPRLLREEPETRLLVVDMATGEAEVVASFARIEVAPRPLAAAASGHVVWTTLVGDVQTYRDGRVVTLVEGDGSEYEPGLYAGAAW